MSIFYRDKHCGYKYAIEKGLFAIRRMGDEQTEGTGTREQRIERLARELCEADAVVVGAGAGLSTSAGFSYSGKRYDDYFFDFSQAYGIKDMYSGGFLPFPRQGDLLGMVGAAYLLQPLRRRAAACL